MLTLGSNGAIKQAARAGLGIALQSRAAVELELSSACWTRSPRAAGCPSAAGTSCAARSARCARTSRPSCASARRRPRGTRSPPRPVRCPLSFFRFRRTAALRGGSWPGWWVFGAFSATETHHVAGLAVLVAISATWTAILAGRPPFNAVVRRGAASAPRGSPPLRPPGLTVPCGRASSPAAPGCLQPVLIRWPRAAPRRFTAHEARPSPWWTCSRPIPASASTSRWPPPGDCVLGLGVERLDQRADAVAGRPDDRKASRVGHREQTGLEATPRSRSSSQSGRSPPRPGWR